MNSLMIGTPPNRGDVMAQPTTSVITAHPTDPKRFDIVLTGPRVTGRATAGFFGVLTDDDVQVTINLSPRDWDDTARRYATYAPETVGVVTDKDGYQYRNPVRIDGADAYDGQVSARRDDDGRWVTYYPSIGRLDGEGITPVERDLVVRGVLDVIESMATPTFLRRVILLAEVKRATYLAQQAEQELRSAQYADRSARRYLAEAQAALHALPLAGLD